MYNPVSAELAETAERYRDRTALEIGHSRLTYGHLHSEARDLERLHGPCRDGSLVGVWAIASPATYTAIFWTLVLGHGYMPIDPVNVLSRAAPALTLSGVHVIVHDGTMPEVVQDDLVGASFCVHDASARRPSPCRSAGDSRRHGADGVACVLTTSGSTGKPKAVSITWTNLGTFVAANRKQVYVDSRARVVVSLPAGGHFLVSPGADHRIGHPPPDVLPHSP